LSEVGVVRSGDQKEIQQTVGTITNNWAATGILVAVESCGGEVERIGRLIISAPGFWIIALSLGLGVQKRDGR
jgi:hypothetical protein